jgi:hypothetical protein
MFSAEGLEKKVRITTNASRVEGGCPVHAPERPHVTTLSGTRACCQLTLSGEHTRQRMTKSCKAEEQGAHTGPGIFVWGAQKSTLVDTK